LIVGKDYSPASTMAELAHQSMNLLQSLLEAKTRHQFEAQALRQAALQDIDLKRHFPGNRRAHRASNLARFLHQ